MPTPQDLLTGKDKLWIKVASIADSGEGKTHFAATFPKCLFLITGQGEDITWKLKPHLLKNIVRWEYFIPNAPEDTKRTFAELSKMCLEAKEMANKGEIETIVLDNLTYLARDRWNYIQIHEKIAHTSKNGEFDALRAYGSLSQDLFNFCRYELLNINCNVVLNMHLKVENEEAMARKSDQSSPEVAAVLGGFRNELNGLVDLVTYLIKVPQPDGSYKYMARCNKGKGKNAKSRINLPPVIENISYQTLKNELDKSIKGE